MKIAQGATRTMWQALSKKEQERDDNAVWALIWCIVFVYDAGISKVNVHAEIKGETATSGFVFLDYLTVSPFGISGILNSSKRSCKYYTNWNLRSKVR
jgi:hypothetical protein